MHKCTKCGREFEGKFCPECGEKFIDKDACPKCGAHHAPDAKYCEQCGARLDGKSVCPRCGALSEGAFCAKCGAKLGGAKVAFAGNAKVKSIISISAFVCFALAALMGLVFTFVTGVKIGNANETQLLYHYFGDVYKDVDKMRSTLKSSFNWSEIGEAREFALYFPAVLGTVVSALGIIGVVVLCGLTAYKAYLKYYKKREVNVVAPAIGAYLCFAVLATVLLALSATEMSGFNVSGYSSANVGGTNVAFSAPTLAGLITGGVLLGLGVVLSALDKFEAFKGFNGVAAGIFALVTGALAVVVIALAALPAVLFEMSFQDSSIGIDLNISVKFGLFSGLDAALMTIKEDDIIFDFVAYCATGGVAVLAIAVISAVIIFRKATALSRGESKRCLVLCAVNVALAAAYLACTIFFAKDFSLFVNKLIGTNAEEIVTGYAVPIALLVFAVLACAVEVVKLFVLRGGNAAPSEQSEEPSECVQPEPAEEAEEPYAPVGE